MQHFQSFEVAGVAADSLESSVANNVQKLDTASYSARNCGFQGSLLMQVAAPLFPEPAVKGLFHRSPVIRNQLQVSHQTSS